MVDEEREFPVGMVVGHGTDPEDGVADVGLALQLPDGAQLWCGEITRERWNEAIDGNSDAAYLGEDDGWWIILYAKDEAKVIGKCVDQYVAAEMLDMLAAAIRAQVSA